MRPEAWLFGSSFKGLGDESRVAVMKIKIIEAADQLGLGGTELALENFCRYLDRAKFAISAVGFRKGGVREAILRDLGLEVIIVGEDRPLWENLLRRTDVLHWHGSGHLAADVFEPVARIRPPLVIQTNVFGLSDNSSFYETIDCDLYVSKMCLVRRVSEDGENHDKFHNKRLLLYNPVDLSRLNQNMPSPDEIQTFKHSKDLNGSLIIGSISRPADGLIDPLVFNTLDYLRHEIPNIKLLLIGATPSLLTKTKKTSLAKYIRVFSPTLNLKELLKYYCSIDVYLSASSEGHSFGMNIAEAMSCGLPVVAISTPNGCNAQIELVDNGKTGCVVGPYPRVIASVIRKLLMNPEKLREMGKTAKLKVKVYGADGITRSLENLIHHKIGLRIDRQDGLDDSLPPPWSPDIDADYRRRLADVFAQPRLDDRLRKTMEEYGGSCKIKMSRILKRVVNAK